MPKLWTETIEEHRREVRAAILDAAWDLVAAHGPTSVTMSQVAERAGIGRATLYKYFSGVEDILVAWHERHVAGHLEHLAALSIQPGDAVERLEAVLGAYALICYHRGGAAADLAALVHRDEHVEHAERRLSDLFRDLLGEAAANGDIRRDARPGELASYCLHALAAAGSLPSQAAVSRLVATTMAGLRAPARAGP